MGRSERARYHSRCVPDDMNRPRDGRPCPGRLQIGRGASDEIEGHPSGLEHVPQPHSIRGVRTHAPHLPCDFGGW
jgi:hypothetical protein